MLSDKIWITRKTRIYSEQRLINANLISTIIVIWYSLLLVFFSLWNFVNPNNNINIFLIFGSVVVLAASIFITAQRYAERSIAMRNCYIKLDELYIKAVEAQKENNNSLLQDIQSEYSSILMNIENHSEFDFLCLRFSLKENQVTTLPPFTTKDHFIFYGKSVLRIVFIGVIFLIPIAPIFIIKN